MRNHGLSFSVCPFPFLGVIMLNIVKAFGTINFIISLIIGLCAIFMLTVVYMGLAFLFGF